MPRKTATAKDAAGALRDKALSYSDAEPSVACKGTALECLTVKTKGKAFLFVRDTDARFKVVESRPEVQALAAKDPDHYAIGATGWVTIKFGEGKHPPLHLLEKWLQESYLCMVGKPSGQRRRR